MRLRELFTTTKSQLEAIAGDTAHTEAEDIIQSLIHCERVDLYTSGDRDVAPDIVSQTDAIIKRRAAHEPLQYILGTAWFHNVKLAVTPDVLIPRSDTETLVEAVLAGERQQERFFLDMGTGSGAISLALLHMRPFWTGVCSDISRSALRIARHNLGSIENNRSFCTACDRLSAIRPATRFDFIVSNPPYISTPEMPQLDCSVRDFEPRLALFGGEDGLDFYRYLAKNAKQIIDRGASLYCEIGWTQREQVKKIFTEQEWRDVTCINDLGGRPRVVTAIL